MDTCLECGNGDMRVRLVDALPVHECSLCGARFGDPTAVAALAASDEAVTRGVAPGIWPLVRVLERLPGVAVRQCAPGDAMRGGLPFVELATATADGLVQLENLAKSLQLGARELRVPWVIEVEYRRHLAFVLKPRDAWGTATGDHVRAAQADLVLLGRCLERDRRLGWWRHAGGGRDG